MLLAVLIIGALLGLASEAQAGRRCIVCANSKQVRDCGEDDVSKYIPDAPIWRRWEGKPEGFDTEKIMIEGRFRSVPL